jgi:PEP-CTERM motif
MRPRARGTYAIGGFSRMRQARHIWGGLFTLILFLTWPSNSLADGIALSGATLNWTGMTFTVTGLTTISVDPAILIADSHASTTLGALSENETFSDSSVPRDLGNTSASSQHSTGTGSAVAQAATAFGLLTSNSQASATLQQPSTNFAQSSAVTTRDFWFYGSGVGSLTVSVPYTLSAACNISQPQVGDQMTAADASVFLEVGPGAGWYASDTISCQNNPGIKNGVLTLSMGLTNPTWGPLVDIEAGVATSAAAKVPEPSSLLLLGIGAIGFGSIVKRKFFS